MNGATELHRFEWNGILPRRVPAHLKVRPSKATPWRGGNPSNPPDSSRSPERGDQKPGTRRQAYNEHHSHRGLKGAAPTNTPGGGCWMPINQWMEDTGPFMGAGHSDLHEETL